MFFTWEEGLVRTRIPYFISKLVSLIEDMILVSFGGCFYLTPTKYCAKRKHSGASDMAWGLSILDSSQSTAAEIVREWRTRETMNRD